MNNGMKKMRKVFTLAVFFVSMVIYAERIIVDEIRTIVYSEDGARIILTSDIKPDLDGRPRGLYDVVCEEVLVLEADRFHIKVTPEDVERYLGDLQKNNNMSRSAMERAMDEMGYSYAQGMEKLRRRQQGEQLIDHHVRGNAKFVVTSEDIEKFDTENKTFDQAVYTLAEAVVPEDGTDVMSKKFSNAELDALPWDEPFEVKERDLSENMQFVAQAQEGEIVLREPTETGNHVEIIRLISKKPQRRIALDEVIEPVSKKTLGDKIADVIRMQRFEGLLKEYQNELLDKSTLRFTYDKDRGSILKK